MIVYGRKKELKNGVEAVVAKAVWAVKRALATRQEYEVHELVRTAQDVDRDFDE